MVRGRSVNPSYRYVAECVAGLGGGLFGTGIAIADGYALVNHQVATAAAVAIADGYGLADDATARWLSADATAIAVGIGQAWPTFRCSAIAIAPAVASGRVDRVAEAGSAAVAETDGSGWCVYTYSASSGCSAVAIGEGLIYRPAYLLSSRASANPAGIGFAVRGSILFSGAVASAIGRGEHFMRFRSASRTVAGPLGYGLATFSPSNRTYRAGARGIALPIGGLE